MELTVKVVAKLNHEFGLPTYATSGSAGFDLRANEEVTLFPGDYKLVKTGLFIQLPYNYELQIRPRSGLALKNGITVLNTPGTVDSDYIGEIGIILYNTSKELFKVNIGDRIAQAVLNEVAQAKFVEVKELKETERGEGGFGSSGK